MTDVNKILQNTANELSFFANIEVQFTGKRIIVRPVIKVKQDKKKSELKLGI